MEIYNSPKSLLERIRSIPSGSVKLAFFVLPPLHLLYLFSILQLTRQKEEDNKKLLFYILGIGLAAFVLGSFFLINLPGIFDIPILKGQILIFEFGLLVIYLMFLLHLSIVTVDYDRKKETQRYFEFTDMDYAMRFITLLFLPISIWHLHSRIKPFNGNSMNT